MASQWNGFSFISQLAATSYPDGATERVNTLDDYLNDLALLLVAQFPNFTAAAVNASVAEMNHLVGLTGLPQVASQKGQANGYASLDGSTLVPIAEIPTMTKAKLPSDSYFDTGVRVVFNQTAAPTGWTKETAAAYNNVALRGTTGSVGTSSAGGAFDTIFASSRTTSGKTGSIQQNTNSGASSVAEYAHEHNFTMQVEYYEVIVATKDSW